MLLSSIERQAVILLLIYYLLLCVSEFYVRSLFLILVLNVLFIPAFFFRKKGILILYQSRYLALRYSVLMCLASKVLKAVP